MTNWETWHRNRKRARQAERSLGLHRRPGCPVSARFENLENGGAKEQFLDWFGGVEEWKGQSRSRTCGEVPQSFRTTAQITEGSSDPRDGRGIG